MASLASPPSVSPSTPRPDAPDSPASPASSQDSLLHDPATRRSLRLSTYRDRLAPRPSPSPHPDRRRHAPHPQRDAKVRELKSRALAIPSTGKTPATVRQRMVMQMVYDEITPYPDEAWVSQLGIVIQREYHQVKNWFSNQRQKDARDSRQSPQPSNLESSLCKISCDARDMRIRTSALDVCPAGEWSDTFFNEVVMIHNFRLLAKHSQDEARAALIESPVTTTDLPYPLPLS